MIERSSIDRRPDRVNMRERKTQNHLFFYSPDYKSLDPFDESVPEEALRINSDNLKYREDIYSVIGPKSGRMVRFGLDDKIQEIDGMGCTNIFSDLDQRENVIILETMIQDLKVPRGIFAKLINRYNLYANGVGIYQKIYHRDRFAGQKKGRIIEDFVLNQHFITVKDISTINEIVKYFVENP